MDGDGERDVFMRKKLKVNGLSLFQARAKVKRSNKYVKKSKVNYVR